MGIVMSLPSWPAESVSIHHIHCCCPYYGRHRQLFFFDFLSLFPSVDAPQQMHPSDRALSGRLPLTFLMPSSVDVIQLIVLTLHVTTPSKNSLSVVIEMVECIVIVKGREWISSDGMYDETDYDKMRKQHIVRSDVVTKPFIKQKASQ